MEDQGIMALPPGQAMQGPTARPAAPQVDPAAEAAFDQMRQQVDPKEFGDELLASAAEADPVAVQQFLQAITQLNLPPEMIDALGQMVDAILAEPEKYAEIRAEFIAEGVPAEILPEQFDAAYFGALNLALDQMSARLPQEAPAPQGFAKGGIAKLPIAAGIAQMGRKGDTMVAHITPSEARMLRRRGGSGTINPRTGLPEFFLKKVAKAVGNVFKSVGNAVSSAVKSVGKEIKRFANSTVGKIVTTVALGFFLGPAAASFLGVTSAAGVAAVSGFIGSAGSTLLAGGSVKDALKSGVVGGITAGVGAGVFGGTEAFASGSYTGPTTVSGQFQSLTDKLSTLTGTPTTAAGPTAPGLPETGTLAGQGTPPTTPGTAIPEAIQPPPMVATAPGAGVDVAGTAQGIGPVPGTPSATAPGPAPGMAPTLNVGDVEAQLGGFYGNTPTTTFDPYAQNVWRVELDQAGNRIPGKFGFRGDVIDNYGRRMLAGNVPPSQPGVVEQLSNQDFTGAGKTALQNIKDFYSPQADPAQVSKLYDQKLAELTLKYPRMDPAILQTRAMDLAEKAAAPMFGTTSRIVGTGIGALALTGGFKSEPTQPLNIAPKETGTDLLKKYPEIYGVRPGGANIVYGPYITPPRFAQGGIAALAPRRFNMGGFAGYAQGGMGSKFPRRTGPINGPGTGTSDSIPAMLSDGEFVFTAKAVRGAGKGSRKEGARRMYAMMKALERKA